MNLSPAVTGLTPLSTGTGGLVASQVPPVMFLQILSDLTLRADGSNHKYAPTVLSYYFLSTFSSLNVTIIHQQN